MPPSGVDYASRFLNGYAPEYVSIIREFVFFIKTNIIRIMINNGNHKALVPIIFIIYIRLYFLVQTKNKIIEDTLLSRTALHGRMIMEIMNIL
jgi:hypothetical protein